MSVKTAKHRLAEVIMKVSEMMDEPHLNSSLCLIFNGMASMIAIVFIVMFFIGYKTPLLFLGVSGCAAMTLANITDLFPFWLRALSKAMDGRNNLNMPKDKNGRKV